MPRIFFAQSYSPKLRRAGQRSALLASMNNSGTAISRTPRRFARYETRLIPPGLGVRLPSAAFNGVHFDTASIRTGPEHAPDRETSPARGPVSVSRCSRLRTLSQILTASLQPIILLTYIASQCIVPL